MSSWACKESTQGILIRCSTCLESVQRTQNVSCLNSEEKREVCAWMVSDISGFALYLFDYSTRLRLVLKTCHSSYIVYLRHSPHNLLSISRTLRMVSYIYVRWNEKKRRIWRAEWKKRFKDSPRTEFQVEKGEERERERLRDAIATGCCAAPRRWDHRSRFIPRLGER